MEIHLMKWNHVLWNENKFYQMKICLKHHIVQHFGNHNLALYWLFLLNVCWNKQLHVSMKTSYCMLQNAGRLQRACTLQTLILLLKLFKYHCHSFYCTVTSINLSKYHKAFITWILYSVWVMHDMIICCCRFFFLEYDIKVMLQYFVLTNLILEVEKKKLKTPKYCTGLGFQRVCYVNVKCL